MSVDLLAGNADTPQSLNRYPYVLNDPVNLVDPLGLCEPRPCPCEDGLPGCVCCSVTVYPSPSPVGRGGSRSHLQEGSCQGLLCAWAPLPSDGAGGGFGTARELDPNLPFDLLGFASNFSAGAGDLLTTPCGLALGTSCTEFIRQKLRANSVVKKDSGAYLAGAATGAGIVASVAALSVAQATVGLQTSGMCPAVCGKRLATSESASSHTLHLFRLPSSSFPVPRLASCTHRCDAVEAVPTPATQRAT
jgi:hypothetical protein